jgi:hypothetical protein
LLGDCEFETDRIIHNEDHFAARDETVGWHHEELGLDVECLFQGFDWFADSRGVCRHGSATDRDYDRDLKVIFVVNDSVRLEFAVPEQRSKERQVFIRNLAEGMKPLTSNK